MYENNVQSGSESGDKGRGNDATGDRNSSLESDQISSASSSTSLSSCTGTPVVIHTSQVKTLVRTSNENMVEGERETLREPTDEVDRSPSNSSTSRRYKFGLTNHFITMPDVGQQQDAKFYQKKLAKHERQARHTAGRKTRAGLALLDGSVANLEPLNVELGEPRREPSGDQTLSHNQGDDNDDCDLSVMGPSSPGSAVSSLLHEAAWPSSELLDAADSGQPARAARSIGPLEREQQQRRRAELKFDQHQSHLAAGLQAPVLPAGDAGLDATKCNSKAAGQHSYLQAQSSYLSHPAAKRKSVSSGTLTARQSRLGAACSKELKDTGPAKEQQCDPNGLLVRFSSIMYATFLVILGCILHVSELRQKSKNSSDHIYTTIVALMGIVWLIFLQMDLQRYKRYASKYILLESIFNDHQRAVKRAQSGANRSPLDPTARSTTSSSASLVNDRMSMNTEVIFKKTAYKMYQQQAAAAAAYRPLDHGGTRLVQQHQHHNQHHGYQPKVWPHHEDSASMGGRSFESASRPSLIPAYKFLHGKMGANFYLKCGMAAFCFGHVIHEGLRFGQQVYFFATNNLACCDSAALVAHLVTPLYSFYQLFMMFKYSNLVINRHKILAKFGLMHIIGTCVTFWFRTILEEAFEDFVHKMDYFKSQNKPVNQYLDPTISFRNNELQHTSAPVLIVDDSPTLISWLEALTSLTGATGGQAGETKPLNITAAGGIQQVAPHNISLAQSALFTLMSSPISASISPQLVRHIPDSYHCAQNTLLTTKSMNALPYLYPFTIEYNLLIAATFLSLYFNIGKIGLPGSLRCAPNQSCYKQPDNKSQVSAATSGSKVYRLNISKQPSLVSGLSYNGDLSDANSASALQRYAPTGELHHGPAGWPPSGSYPHASGMSKAGHEPPPGDHLGEYKSNFVVNADCHAANKGLFLGFFVLLVMLVTIVIFFVTINKPSHLQLGIKINLIQEATLTSLILIVTLAGYRQIMRLNRNPLIRDKVTTDDVLMLIPLPFFFIHSLLSFRAETATLYAPSHLTKTLLHSQQQQQHQHQQQQQDQGFKDASESAARMLKLNQSLAGGVQGQRTPNGLAHLPAMVTHGGPAANQSGEQQRQRDEEAAGLSAGANIDHYKLLTIALNLAVMLEVIIQTNFIIDGLRRCSESRYLRFKKPGRELITFAILLNITYWIVATFETKSVEQYKTEIEYYGPLPYMFISHTTLPVMLFYRYHSSVCLAEIWNRAYKPPKRR